MLGFFLFVYLLSSPTCSQLLSRHRRTWIIDLFTIEEGHPGPFPYTLGKIHVEKESLGYFRLCGEGVNKDPKGVLSINRGSGIVSVHRPVDYEERNVLKPFFEASEKESTSSADIRLGVEIIITDINDNPPLFQSNLYQITTEEEIAQGSVLVTVVAHDRDMRGSPNSTFHYELKSVSPKTENTQFFVDRNNGKISFKGCLNPEGAGNFTLLVEARDHGEVVSLSSSTTVVIHVMENKHLPTIIGKTGSGKVKEGKNGTSPLRLHVTDRDTPHSAAWRARYTIHGDGGRHFRIETDTETNDGILTVHTPLDYEEAATKELTISVENEAPFFHCTVKEKTPSGLWKVDTIRGDDARADQPQSVNVTIEVEDVNDPPAFSVTDKQPTLEENSPVGTWIEKVTANDPDSNLGRDFVYKVGEDPAGWVKVDPKTGDITTVKIPDREAPNVVNGVYTVLIYAVDNGQPPMTGTATLNIHVIDQNDNVPQLEANFLGVCVSDDIITTNIIAFDLDENPFGGPFTFELLGEVQGKWKLDPSYGYTAGLVKEPAVYAGLHKVCLKVSDLQGQFYIYDLNVTACNCSITPDCRILRGTARASSGAIVVVLAALLLVMVGLFLSVSISCKKKFMPLQLKDSEGATLASDIEPGTDFKVPVVVTYKKHQDNSNFKSQHNGAQHKGVSKNKMEQKFLYKHSEYRTEPFSLTCLSQEFYNSWNQRQQISSGTIIDVHHQQHQAREGSSMNMSSENIWDEAVLALLQKRFSALQETEDVLLDYEPLLYAEEGGSDDLSELENISIPESDSFHKVLDNLSPDFNNLASICRLHQK